MNKRMLLTGVLVAATFSLASCGKVTPAENRNNVANVQEAGVRDVAETKAKAEDAMAGAQRDLSKSETEVAHEDATARHSISIAEAEAEYKTALERCAAQAGDAKRLCRKHADAELELAKARSNVARAEADPKP